MWRVVQAVLQRCLRQQRIWPALMAIRRMMTLRRMIPLRKVMAMLKVMVMAKVVLQTVTATRMVPHWLQLMKPKPTLPKAPVGMGAKVLQTAQVPAAMKAMTKVMMKLAVKAVTAKVAGMVVPVVRAVVVMVNMHSIRQTTQHPSVVHHKHTAVVPFLHAVAATAAHITSSVAHGVASAHLSARPLHGCPWYANRESRRCQHR